MKWLQKASIGGNTRAQYQLALCLHRCCGTRSNMKEAVGALSYSHPHISNYEWFCYFLLRS